MVENLVFVRGGKKKKSNKSESANGIFFAELLTFCVREEMRGGVRNGPAFLIVQNYRLPIVIFYKEPDHDSEDYRKEFSFSQIPRIKKKHVEASIYKGC